jgi:hypothetical protein
MPKLFRQVPPKELLEGIFFHVLNLRSLEDSTWFSKLSIHLDELEGFFPQLEPYYVPCKAKEFLHRSLTSSRAVTIIRQLITAAGYELIAQEKTCGGVKGMWYQISAPKKILGGAVTIDFS